MLILSRREAEKILLPSLGITIEVTRVHGRTVRLGIDAPDEIRIIRAELEDTGDLKKRKPQIEPNSRYCHSWNAPHDIQKCLDAANLAIHLAQNQLRQQLNEKAEEALEHALECMENLEIAASNAPIASTPMPVRESKTEYQRHAKKVAIVVDENKHLGCELKQRLDGQGYTTLQLDSGESLIEFLQSRNQPNLVLTLDQPIAEEPVSAEQPHWPDEFPQIDNGFDDSLTRSAGNLEGKSEPEPRETSRAGLRMFGVGSLQKTSQIFSLGDLRVTGWFAESADAEAIANCFNNRIFGQLKTRH